MTTWLITHPSCLEHDTGEGHPESSERLRAVLAALETPQFQDLLRHEAPAATEAQLCRVHQRGYVREVLAQVPAQGLHTLDADTVVSPASGEAALHAAGALIAAVDAVLGDQANRAFCAVRPPGHHAETARAMGFCLFNNIAVGAAHAREAHGLKRIAVVDFDVHHGNGTQHMLAERPGYLYLSIHQSPLYPGTGLRSGESGDNIVNLPLPPFAGSDAFREVYEHELLPALDRYAPELILISAGFDAHRDDPLANLRLVESDYAWATERTVDIAQRHCGGRVISTLEGGYNLRALAASAAAHVQALL